MICTASGPPSLDGEEKEEKESKEHTKVKQETDEHAHIDKHTHGHTHKPKLPRLLGAALLSPSVFRVVVDFLIWLLPDFDTQFPEHATDCCVLLGDICRVVLSLRPPETDTETEKDREKDTEMQTEQQDKDKDRDREAKKKKQTAAASEELALLVPDVVTAILAYYQQDTPTETHTHTETRASTERDKERDGKDAKDKDKDRDRDRDREKDRDRDRDTEKRTKKGEIVARVLKSIFDALPTHLTWVIKTLDPLPDVARFDELNKRYKALCGERSLPEEIHRSVFLCV